MATKENDENKDQNSEEDFGLPDLEFEELDDIDEVEESDEEDELADLVSTDSDEGTDLEVADTAEIEDIVLDEPEASEEVDPLDNIGSDTEESTDEELNLESDSSSDDLLGETSDDTDSVDLDDDLMASFSQDDEEEEDEEEELASTYQPVGVGGSQNFTKIIIIGLVGAVAMAFFFLYWHNQNPPAEEAPTAEVAEAEGAEMAAGDSTEVEGAEQESTPDETEATASIPPKETPGAAKSTPAATQQQAAPTPRPVRTQPAAAANSGQVTAITSATGRYYIIVASFIDDDMANDHGNRLANQGAAVKIINPFGGKQYWRVSVADYGTLREAVNGTNQLKPQYGDDIWAVKY